MSADRRAVLRLAAGAILLPVLAARPAVAQGRGRFLPPAGPMRYARRLERTMADGAILAVSREFSVRFVTRPEGFLVEGSQTGVSVDAPPKLAAFAALERERTEQGLFPLTLDEAGRIFGARPAVRTAELDAAVGEALAHYANLGQSRERAEIVGFINALHQGASKLVTELPVDLFAPSEPDRRAVSEVALPDGESGEVIVRFSAQADPLTGVMKEAMREVVTALADDRRRTVETWHLTAI